VVEAKTKADRPLWAPAETMKSLAALKTWPVGEPPGMATVRGFLVTALPFTSPL
jgi:hypothetical protein